MKICRLSFHMLTTVRVMSNDVIQSLAAVPARDYHRQAQCLTQRFQRVVAQQLQVLHRLGRRIISNAMFTCRGASDELMQREVRCQKLDFIRPFPCLGIARHGLASALGFIETLIFHTHTLLMFNKLFFNFAGTDRP